MSDPDPFRFKPTPLVKGGALSHKPVRGRVPLRMAPSGIPALANPEDGDILSAALDEGTLLWSMTLRRMERTPGWPIMDVTYWNAPVLGTFTEMYLDLDQVISGPDAHDAPVATWMEKLP